MFSGVSKNSLSPMPLTIPLLSKEPILFNTHQEVSPLDILEAELRTIAGDLEGHSGSINAIEITSDQKSIISGSSDSKIIIWSLLVKKPWTVLEGHSDEVLCLTLSSDDSLLVSGSSDKTGKLWDLTSRQALCTFIGHLDKINSVNFIESKKMIVTGSNDKSIKLWDFSGQLIYSFEGHSHEVLTCISFESFLVTGSVDGSVKVWSIDSLSHVQDLFSCSFKVVSLAVTRDMSHFASAEYEKNIKIWNAKTFQMEYSFLDGERINCIRFSGNNEFLVSCSDDYFNYIWNLKLRQRTFSISLYPKTASCIGVNYDGSIIVTGCNDKSLKIWTADEKRDDTTFYPHSDEIRQIDITNDGKSFLTASFDGTVRVFDMETNESEVFQSSEKENSICLCLSKNEAFVISGHSNGLIKVWDPETLKSNSLSFHSKEIWSLDAKDHLLVSGSKDRHIILWDLERMEVKTILSKDTHVAVCLKFFKNSKKIASGGEDNCLKIWDFEKNLEEICISGHSDQIWALCITQDDKFLITGSKDKSIKVWNSETFVEELTVAEGQGSIRRLLLTKDERVLISASYSKDIKFWKWKERKEEFVLKGHNGFVRSLALICEERKLASCSDDKTVIIWNIEGRKIEAVLRGHGGWVRDICLINDKTLLSCSQDENMIIWDIQKLKLSQFLTLTIGKVYTVTTDNKNKIAICGTDKNITLVLHLMKMKVINSLAGHSDIILTTAISKNNQTAGTGSKDKSIKLWDLSNFKEKFTLTGHTDYVTSIVFSNDSKSLISGSEDKLINIWNLESKAIDFSFQVHNSYITSLLLSKSNEIFTASQDKNVKVLSLQHKKFLYSTPTEANFIQSLCLSPDETRLAYASFEKIIIFNTKKRKIEFFLSGHSKGAVLGLKFLLNNQKLISGSTDGSLKTWNFLKQPKTISWPSDRTMSLCLSNDKQKLVCGLKSGEVKIWNFETKSLYFSSKGHQDTVWDVSVSDNDSLVATASLDKTIKVWSLPKKRLEFTLKGHTDCVRNVKFLHNDEKIASCSWDKTIRIWDIKSRTEDFSLQGHNNRVISLCKYENNIITGGAEGKILFWDLESKQVSFVLNGDSRGIWCLVCDEENKQLISSSFDAVIKIWSLKDKTLIGTLTGHKDGISCIIKINKSLLASCSYDKLIKIWNLDNFTEIQSFSAHTDKIYSLAQINSNELLSCSWDKTIRTWKVKENVEGSVFKGFSAKIEEVILSENRIFLATDSSVKIFNLLKFEEEAVLMGHSDIVTCLAFLPESNLLITGSKDCSLGFWDISTKTMLKNPKEHTNGVKSLQLTSDSKQILSSSLDNSIKIWDIQSKTVLATLRGHKSGVSCIKLSKNQEIISVSEDSTIKIWSLLKKTEISTIQGFSSFLTVLLIQNEKFFATGSVDCLVRIWDFEAKREVFKLAGHSESVLALVESPDCKYLISGGEDFLVKVWNVSERRLQFDLSGHLGPVRSLAFSSNGVLFSASEDNTVKIWEIDGKKMNGENFSRVTDSNLMISSDGKSFGHVYDENNEIIASFYSPYSSFDAFYQDKSIFFNVIDSLKDLKFGDLSESARLIIISRFYFTVSHFLSYLGLSETLQKVLTPEGLITRDIFGKSPFFYAIQRKHLKCAEILMDSIILLFESPEAASFQTSLFAISGEFAMIIRNSIRKIEIFLSLCLIQSSHGLISSEIEFPSYSFNQFYNPSESDFLSNQFNNNTNQIDPVTVIFSHLPFEVPYIPGSLKSIELLESMLNCKKINIFSTTFVMSYIDFHWKSVRIWVFLYSLLLLSNLFFLIVMTDSNPNFINLVIFIVLNAFLLIWEVAQVLTLGLKYFSDIWNFIDLVRVVATCVWLILPDIQYLEILVILLNFIRGLTAFHMFDGTRFYINLIFRAVNDVKYFLLLFVYSNLMFGALYSAKDQKDLSFNTLWLDMYSLNFGIYETENNKSPLGIFIFIGATLINLVVMLNLLISILGDSYDQFQIEKVIVDYLEKAQLVFEVEKMFFWKKSSNFYGIFHVVNMEEMEEQYFWQGRISYLQNLIENIDKNIKFSFSSMASGIAEKVEGSVLPEIEKSLIKIDRVQENLKDNQSFVEGQYNGTKMCLDDLNEQVKGIEKILRERGEFKGSDQSGKLEDFGRFEEKLNECQEVLMEKIREVQESNKKSVEFLECKLDRIEKGLSKILEKID